MLIQTLFRLCNQYSFLQPDQVLTLRTQLPHTKYKNQQMRAVFYQQVLERVQVIPGVVSAGYTTAVPLVWKGGTSGFYPEGTREALSGMSYDSNHRQVSANYLQTLNVPLRQGRYFDNHDNAESMKVAIVNASAMCQPRATISQIVITTDAVTASMMKPRT